MSPICDSGPGLLDRELVHQALDSVGLRDPGVAARRQLHREVARIPDRHLVRSAHELGRGRGHEAVQVHPVHPADHRLYFKVC